ncbi:hypothetical protein DLM85_17450 [Hymenobacter edaphi]|uniref:Uncharacterized protein n=1 Tax=Hymenobacter edaphi TaxID=2211146 RepID=A0A328BFJ9_9BACT|nr:hypothetical protein DLM85_17450 [Hymenobacter edaphi]
MPYDVVQRWVIRLGWLSLALWGLLVLAEVVPLEFISPDRQLNFRLAVAALGWVWPLALSLKLRRRIRPSGLRALLVGLACLLTLPALAVCALGAVLSGMAYYDTWEDERVLWRRSGSATARVVVQLKTDDSAQGNDQWRVVQLTPVLGLWQQVTPVDTARFDATGWQRVRR